MSSVATLGVGAMLVDMLIRELYIYENSGKESSYFFSLFFRHFVQTQHTFAMQLGTQRVWDYIGGIVHTGCVRVHVEQHVMHVYLSHVGGHCLFYAH